MLTEFGERVRSTIRGSDSAFRNSGGADEFFLILPETSREESKLLYDRLAFEMRSRPFDDWDRPVTMSAGLVELQPGEAADLLLKRANQAMWVAKNSGKDRLVTDADGLALPRKLRFRSMSTAGLALVAATAALVVTVAVALVAMRADARRTSASAGSCVAMGERHGRPRP